MSRDALRVHLVSLPWLVLAATSPSAGDVLITEFLAAGDGGISVDEDGEGSDWLELHNDGAGEVDLDGWYLTDDRRDLTRWRIPAVRLAPEGVSPRLRVGEGALEARLGAPHELPTRTRGGGDPDSPTKFYHALRANPEFRLLFRIEACPDACRE